MLPIVVLPAARDDQLDQVEYFDAEAGEAVADRFVRQCEAGFARLSRFPESGTRVRYRHPALRDCRFIPVPKFADHLIFYRLHEGRVEIVRILHGARDIEAALDPE